MKWVMRFVLLYVYVFVYLTHIVHGYFTGTVAMIAQGRKWLNHHMNLREPWWRHQMETFSALLAICAGNSPVPVNFPHKGQWRGALMFALICVWIIAWVNNRKASDLRRYRLHYDVIVMSYHNHKKTYAYFMGCAHHTKDDPAIIYFHLTRSTPARVVFFNTITHVLLCSTRCSSSQNIIYGAHILAQ